MTRTRTTCAALCAAFVLGHFGASYAEEYDKTGWRDPRERDEDISGTRVSVEVNRTDSGLYDFVYTVVTPPENKGVLMTVSIDVSCDLSIEDVEMPPSKSNLPSRSRDGMHVPVVMHSSENAGVGAVDPNNQLIWGMILEPGHSATLRVLSPTPPRMRDLTLIPEMDPIGWRYDLYPDAPWIPEFTVHRQIAGPGCVPPDAPNAGDQSNVPEP